MNENDKRTQLAREIYASSAKPSTFGDGIIYLDARDASRIADGLIAAGWSK